MKYQQSSLCEDSVLELRALNFQPVQDDGTTAVFRGLLDDRKAPGAPVYAVTVTTASPGNDKEAITKLKAFLDDMRAGFALTAPDPDEDPCDDEEEEDEKKEPFNINDQTQIEPELVELRTVKGAFGVIVLVHTTIGEVLEKPATAAPRPLARIGRLGARLVARYTGKVRRGQDHRWTARGGFRRTATVTGRQGRGTIRRPNGPRERISVGVSRSLRARTVIVHGRRPGLEYEFLGRFRG